MTCFRIFSEWRKSGWATCLMVTSERSGVIPESRSCATYAVISSRAREGHESLPSWTSAIAWLNRGGTGGALAGVFVATLAASGHE
jgi:hypothetical protein